MWEGRTGGQKAADQHFLLRQAGQCSKHSSSAYQRVWHLPQTSAFSSGRSRNLPKLCGIAPATRGDTSNLQVKPSLTLQPPQKGFKERSLCWAAAFSYKDKPFHWLTKNCNSFTRLKATNILGTERLNSAEQPQSGCCWDPALSSRQLCDSWFLTQGSILRVIICSTAQCCGI